MTNIRNLKKSHLPMTWCQERGTPAHSLVSRPLLRVPSRPQRQPVLTAVAEAFMGRNELAVRVGPTGVHLPECHHLSPGPISPLLLTELPLSLQTHTQDPNLTMHMSTQVSELGGDKNQAACLADARGCSLAQGGPLAETAKRSHCSAQPGADGV